MQVSNYLTTRKQSLLFYIIFLLLLACDKNSTLNEGADKNSSAICDSLFNSAEASVGINGTLATIYLEKGKSFVDLDNSPYYLGRYHMIKGRVLYYQDNYIESISHLDTALHIFEETGNNKELAKANSYSGASHALIGNYPTAIDRCLISSRFNQKTGDRNAESICYNFIGNIYLEQKNYKQALQYVEKAYAISCSDSASMQHALVQSTRGDIYKKTGELEKAEMYLLKSYHTRIRFANIRHVASSLVQLADLRYLQKKYNEAFKYLDEAEQIYTELDEKTGLFNVYYILSRTYCAQDDLSKASHYAEKAYALGLEVNSHGHLEKATQSLAEIFKKANNYQKALEYFEKYHDSHNELISQEKNRLIANIEYNSELTNEIKDNEILRKNNQIKKQQVTYLSILISILLVLFIALSVLFRLRKRNFRNTQMLLEKKKEMAEADSKLHIKEKIILESDLDLKNKELTSKTIELLHQIEILQTLTARMEKLKETDSKKEIEEILHELRMKTRENVWDEFHAAFNNVHQDFYDRLFKICPNLSSTEIKIAALLKLNLSTKEIAAISYKSESAVKTARHRLRHRLNLGQGENLINFLMKI